jgi:SPP1 gp7 family putative phage head morphogenesis protein
MPSVNEQIFDAQVRHMIGLVGFSNEGAADLVKLLNQADRDLVKLLDGALDRLGSDSYTARHLQATLDQVRRTNIAAYNKLGRALPKRLKEAVAHEAEFQSTLFKRVLPAQIGFTTTSATFLKSFVEAPILGEPVASHLSTQAKNRFERIERTLRLGLVEGKTKDQIVRDIRGTSYWKTLASGKKVRALKGGVLRVSHHEASALARTGMMTVTSQARGAIYESNKDILKGVQWTATLDGRTCPICIPLDGRLYKNPAIAPRTPAHMQCRCVLVPITKSWDELGLPVKRGDKRIKATRASMNGQVPAKMNYGQWLRRQPAAFQNAVLGVTRGKLFRANPSMSIGSFINDGRFITLGQLRYIDGLDVPEGVWLPVSGLSEWRTAGFGEQLAELGVELIIDDGLQGFAPAYAEEITLTLRRLQATQPKLAKKIKRIRLSDLKHGEYALAHELKGEIAFGNEWFGIGATKDATEALGKAYRRGYLAADGIDGVITHELGHLIDLKPSEYREFVNFYYGSDVIKTTALNETMLKEWLSEYSIFDQYEMMSEAMSAAMAGVDNELTAAYVKMLRDLDLWEGGIAKGGLRSVKLAEDTKGLAAARPAARPLAAAVDDVTLRFRAADTWFDANEDMVWWFTNGMDEFSSLQNVLDAKTIAGQRAILQRSAKSLAQMVDFDDVTHNVFTWKWHRKIDPRARAVLEKIIEEGPNEWGMRLDLASLVGHYKNGRWVRPKFLDEVFEKVAGGATRADLLKAIHPDPRVAEDVLELLYLAGRTQKLAMRRAGIKSVKAYRGIRIGTEAAEDIIKSKSAQATSGEFWTTNESIARSFGVEGTGGVILEADIPLSDVSWFYGGDGVFGAESGFTIHGGNRIKLIKATKYDPPKGKLPKRFKHEGLVGVSDDAAETVTRRSIAELRGEMESGTLAVNSIDDVEYTLRTGRGMRQERAVLFDKDGKAFEIVEGSETFVPIDGKMTARLKDGVVTHNHPKGGTFSTEDVWLAVRADVKEIRAVGYVGDELVTYSLKRPKGGWPSTKWLNTTGDDILRGHAFLPPSQRSKVWKEFAEASGAKYEELRRKMPKAANDAITPAQVVRETMSQVARDSMRREGFEKVYAFAAENGYELKHIARVADALADDVAEVDTLWNSVHRAMHGKKNFREQAIAELNLTRAEKRAWLMALDTAKKPSAAAGGRRLSNLEGLVLRETEELGTFEGVSLPIKGSKLWNNSRKDITIWMIAEGASDAQIEAFWSTYYKIPISKYGKNALAEWRAAFEAGKVAKPPIFFMNEEVLHSAVFPKAVEAVLEGAATKLELVGKASSQMSIGLDSFYGTKASQLARYMKTHGASHDEVLAYLKHIGYEDASKEWIAGLPSKGLIDITEDAADMVDDWFSSGVLSIGPAPGETIAELGVELVDGKLFGANVSMTTRYLLKEGMSPQKVSKFWKSLGYKNMPPSVAKKMLAELEDKGSKLVPKFSDAQKAAIKKYIDDGLAITTPKPATAPPASPATQFFDNAEAVTKYLAANADTDDLLPIVDFWKHLGVDVESPQTIATIEKWVDDAVKSGYKVDLADALDFSPNAMKILDNFLLEGELPPMIGTAKAAKKTLGKAVAEAAETATEKAVKKIKTTKPTKGSWPSLEGKAVKPSAVSAKIDEIASVAEESPELTSAVKSKKLGELQELVGEEKMTWSELGVYDEFAEKSDPKLKSAADFLDATTAAEIPEHVAPKVLKTIELDKLIATETDGYFSTLRNMVSKSPLFTDAAQHAPLVYRSGDQFFLMNKHHVVAARRLMGQKSASFRVIDIDELAKFQAEKVAQEAAEKAAKKAAEKAAKEAAEKAAKEAAEKAAKEAKQKAAKWVGIDATSKSNFNFVTTYLLEQRASLGHMKLDDIADFWKGMGFEDVTRGMVAKVQNELGSTYLGGLSDEALDLLSDYSKAMTTGNKSSAAGVIEKALDEVQEKVSKYGSKEVYEAHKKAAVVKKVKDKLEFKGARLFGQTRGNINRWFAQEGLSAEEIVAFWKKQGVDLKVRSAKQAIWEVETGRATGKIAAFSEGQAQKIHAYLEIMDQDVQMPTAGVPKVGDLTPIDPKGTGAEMRALGRKLADIGTGLASRQRAKEAINEALTNWMSKQPRFQYVPKDVLKQLTDQTIRTWAATSGDSRPLSLLMQKAAAEEFGITKQLHHYSHSSGSVKRALEAADELANGSFKNLLDKAFSIYGTTDPVIAESTLTGMDVARVLIRAQYEATQEWFKAKGITHVTLVRGVRGVSATYESGWGPIQLNPLSSFSTSVATSKNFGTTAITVRVPVSQVFSTARTGFGCLSEYEFVVIGPEIWGYMFNSGGWGQAGKIKKILG